jgi:hypothetical protein
MNSEMSNYSYSNTNYGNTPSLLQSRGLLRFWPIYILIISLILIYPFYTLGNIFAKNSFDTDIVSNNFVNQKTISMYNYRIDRTQLILLANEETVLYTTISNLNNSSVGFSPLVHRVQVLDAKNSIVYEEFQTSYLLPGEVKYLIVNPRNNLGYEIRLIEEPQTNPVLFNPAESKFSQVFKDLEVRNPEFKETLDGKNLELKAVIKNRSLLEIKELNVVYILRSTRDKVVGIGEMKIKYLKSEEEREFYVTYPKPKYRRVNTLDIRPFVNYLDVDNFVL